MGLLIVTGLGLCLWAGYEYMAMAWGDITAALLAGMAALLLAGGFAWLAIRLSR